MTATGTPESPGARAWQDAMIVLALFAIDPVGTVGVRLRGHAGPVRARWLTTLGEMLPPGTPLRKMPANIDAAGLLGGLDFAATLASGRPIAKRGLLSQTDGGVLQIAMAERLAAEPAALIAAALDAGGVVVERDGLRLQSSARFGVIVLDEAIGEDERPPRALIERLAFDIDLTHVALADLSAPVFSASDITDARALLAGVTVDPSVITAVCETAAALGVGSVRADLLALAVARAAAAYQGHDDVDETDASIAARLVFAARATQIPASSQQEAESEPEPAPEPSRPDGGSAPDTSDADRAPEDLGDILRAAVAVVLPADLLARVARAGALQRMTSEGRAGASMVSGTRGRTSGTRAGTPRSGARLNLVETLRAAAPWQTIRKAEAGEALPVGRILVRPADLRVSRFKSRTRTAIVFAVDASGSQALNRLAEAKGAVELLLADCYVRRDQVAVIAFRGITADVILAPTHSLARAKRTLAGLPGGGGTPLATGIDAAHALAAKIRRGGETVLVVLLTDAQANVGRDGTGGRAEAQADAVAAAKAIRLAGYPSVLIDTAMRPAQRARDLADAMGADYVPLPQANAGAVSAVVKQAAAALA
jgi:magnesium chelatase subunit D